MIQIKLDIFPNISLTDIWIIPLYNLPNFINRENCIYCIENQVNEKRYIGKTSWLYGRFEPRITSSFSHYTGYIWQCDTDLGLLIYRALVKYTPDNFKVYLLESNVSDLNSREKYWIKELHTCIYDPECWGYNMTWGGEDHSQLYSEKAIRKRIKTNIEYYGSPIGKCNSPEVRKKVLETLAEQYGGDPYGQIHTESSRRNQVISNMRNHGGVLSMNTESSIKARSLTKIFNRINNYIDSIKNKGLELTGEAVFNEIYSDHKWNNIIDLFSRIPSLLGDYRWTSEITKLYYELYSYCYGRYEYWTTTKLFKYYKLI